MKFRFNIYVWGRGKFGQLGLGNDERLVGFSNHLCQSFLLQQLILMRATTACVCNQFILHSGIVMSLLC